MKYPELTGICKKAIQNNLCNGCSKLELESFTGVEKCKYVLDPIQKIKAILGVQQKIKLP